MFHQILSKRLKKFFVILIFASLVLVFVQRLSNLLTHSDLMSSIEFELEHCNCTRKIFQTKLSTNTFHLDGLSYENRSKKGKKIYCGLRRNYF